MCDLQGNATSGVSIGLNTALQDLASCACWGSPKSIPRGKILRAACALHVICCWVDCRREHTQLSMDMDGSFNFKSHACAIPLEGLPVLILQLGHGHCVSVAVQDSDEQLL